MSDDKNELRRDKADTLPRPLAHTYARLCDELKRNEPVAAAWALRDAWESAVRFVACLGLADLVQAGAGGDKFERALALLFKPTGLSLGDWCYLVSVGCDGSIETRTPRVLPELTTFYSRGGKLTSAVQALSRQGGQSKHPHNPEKWNLAEWRNHVFGHGVFKKDRRWYAEQTKAWLEPLLDFYAALQPILAGWTLRDGGPDGPALTGAGAGLAAGPHGHVASDAGDALVLTGPRGVLRFGPLISAHRCDICQERHAFFYDKGKRTKDGPQGLRIDLLEYVRGHPKPLRGWAAALAWEERIPQEVRWERTAFDQDEVAEGERLVFRNFETEYFRPDWILDRLWQAIDDVGTGYVQLEGPGGVGKSYIARALRQEAGEERDVPVLLHHIMAGTRTDYRTFITLLDDEAKEQLRWRTQQIQAKD